MKLRILPILLILLATSWATAALAEDASTSTAADPGSAAMSDTGDHLTPKEIAADVLGAMDRTADPCQDFYRYACGGWIDSTKIPGDQARWVRSFSVIQERNRQSIRTMLEEAAAHPGKDGERQLIGNFYASCMDEAAVEKAGIQPLQPMLGEIAKIKDLSSFFRVVGLLHRDSIEAAFSTGAFPDFKNPDLNIGFYLQGGLGTRSTWPGCWGCSGSRPTPPPPTPRRSSLSRPSWPRPPGRASRCA